MTEARPPKIKSEVFWSQAENPRNGPETHVQIGSRWLPHWNAKAPTTLTRFLTLSQAAEEFGVDFKVIYALANAGLIDAAQKDGKGRVYYVEAQIRRALSGQYRLVDSAA